MKYKEANLDIFKTDKRYALARCVSADCKTKGKDSERFRNRYPNMTERILAANPDTSDVVMYHHKGRMIFNLIVKEERSNALTHKVVTSAFINLKLKCESLRINKIAVPMLWAGLGEMDWSMLRDIINGVFAHSDVEILVCYN